MEDLKTGKEFGITNLGKVPHGMSFAEAIEKTKLLRKFELNPYEKITRLTICDTLRVMYREADKLPYSKEKEQIQEYILACGDFAKRMDARMKYLKSKLEENGIKY